MQRTDQRSSRLGNEEFMGRVSRARHRDDSDEGGKVTNHEFIYIIRFGLFRPSGSTSILDLSRFNPG